MRREAAQERAAMPPEGRRRDGAGRRIGVLLVNLGSPAGTSYWPMRAYLKEFLSDRRVIEVPRAIWWLILNGIILSVRPQKSGKNYASIWNNDLDEAPLKTITRAQADGLTERLADGSDIVVDWAMRYGCPTIESRIGRLLDRGCDRVLVVPLYPQYAAATTATVNDAVFGVLKRLRFQPALRTAAPWHDDPVYIDALARSLERHLAGLDFEPEVVLASFHGVPLEYIQKGDPYRRQCEETVRLLRARLGWPEERLMLTFQSRFGKAEWLQPYTDKTVERLAREGVKRMAVMMPGFVADCLETIEEIGVENAEIFRHAGGERFAAIPCLNADEEGMAVIERVVRRELEGWVG
ncbi:ferrochelatase [Rhizobiales bacterium Sp-1]|uniref:Ferrochelatase n=2 Tax=Segnochrobactrum spirostomi TaxID=2608987 RepID=A0A6A7Y016_9HYPH|nr:ferrochelatase [Segnochrobactrum spirostomi]